jgi:hypothetical protein
VPNEGLVWLVNDVAELELGNTAGCRWLLAQVPVTTEPAGPKNDTIPLMGVANSFFDRQLGAHYMLQQEIIDV